MATTLMRLYMTELATKDTAVVAGMLVPCGITSGLLFAQVLRYRDCPLIIFCFFPFSNEKNRMSVAGKWTDFSFSSVDFRFSKFTAILWFKNQLRFSCVAQIWFHFFFCFLFSRLVAARALTNGNKFELIFIGRWLASARFSLSGITKTVFELVLSVQWSPWPARFSEDWLLQRFSSRRAIHCALLTRAVPSFKPRNHQRWLFLYEQY